MDPYLSRIPGGDAEYLQSLPAAERASVETAGDPDGLFGKEGMTFHDVLNIVNPLQQLPIISTIYREITGDEIKPGSRLIGGLLYGGPTGLASAVINTVVEYNTGHDIGGEVVAMVTGKPLVTDEARSKVAADQELRATRIANARGESVPAHKAAQFADAAPAPTATVSDAASQPAVATEKLASNQVSTPQANSGATSLPTLPAKGSLGVPNMPALSSPTLTSPAAMASAFPSSGMPAGLAGDTTGLTGKSGLPSAGTITPAAVISMLGQQQQPAARAGSTPSMAPTMAALPMAAAINGPMVPAQRSDEQQSADQAAQQQAAESTAENAAPALRMPARLSIEPRMPAPAKNNGLRTPVIVPPDSIAAVSSAGGMNNPGSDAPIILGTPNAAPASLTPTAQIPDAMLRALDKYDALIKNRHGGSGKTVNQTT